MANNNQEENSIKENKEETKEESQEESKKNTEIENFLNVPVADLAGKQIPVDVLREIPEEAAAFYKMVPISRQGDTLEVGMVNPNDLKAKEALRFITRRSDLEVKIFLIKLADFNEVLRQYRTLRGEVKKALGELEKELDTKEKAGPAKGKMEEIAESIVAEAPITKIVAVILKHAIEGLASDIHIEPAENKLRVRFRVDGLLYTSLLLPKEVQPAVVSRIKILSKLKIDETRKPQDGRFHTVVSGKKIDFRVSTLPTSDGEKVALRVLDPSVGLRTFTDLGLQGYNLEVLKRGIKKAFGMILITGPTGSGKTTTLYTILNKLNEEKTNIISLEDPVEYYIGGLNQSQIRPEIGYSFATGLRHILRQDPDVIMVGEIRDEETAGLAIHAALTGHILLSTLHTNNAIGVVPRLIDMNVGAFLLPPSLNLAIAQRLVKRLCAHCKKEVNAPPQVAKIIDKELEGMNAKQKAEVSAKKPYKIYRPVGCKFCGQKGTKGRIALYEILEMTPQLEEIVNQGPTEGKIREEAKRQEMVTMMQDGVIKVLQGVIAYEEMLRVVEQ